MKTVSLTKESFLKHMNRNHDWRGIIYYCYISQKVFNVKTAQYIYGKQSEIPFQEKEELWDEMWKIALAEQEKNPELTHILVKEL